MSKVASNAAPITVLYDGGCRVCSWEIEKYRKLDRSRSIRFQDIDAPGFDAMARGLDAIRVRQTFHVIGPAGELHIGVSAFAQIWEALDTPAFRLMAAASRKPGIKQALEAGYFIFSKIRPWLPRKSCPGDTCSLEDK